MIDWEKTRAIYEYSDADGLKGIRRPKVICLCDVCEKERCITIRVKSKIINNQLKWKCPSCVALGRSEELSEQMVGLWQGNDYRNTQLIKKHDNNYKSLQSANIKKLWTDNKYRSKFEVGIRIDEYILKCYQKFNCQFIYDTTSFVDWQHKITITCTICDTTFKRKPLQHLHIGYCPTCNTSIGQREIAQFISQYADIELNNRDILNGIELDIITNNKRLAIEYHGLYWHSYNQQETKEQKFRHKNKFDQCHNQNIILLQFFDYEWSNKQHIVKSIIANKLQQSIKIDARKLHVTELTNKQSACFFQTNHLQGNRYAKTIIGLCDNNEIIAAASFNKYKDGYEIIRLATKCGYCVRGGANRLITHFLRKFNYPKLYTFADARISNANVYEKIGFQRLHISNPGYFYYKKQSSKYIILSRQQCQKHKLHKLLGDNFDPTLAESENMFRSGYRRVWNAGNIKLIKQ